MTIDTSQLFANWKSTASGLLTFTLVTTGAFLAPPLNAGISPKHVFWIGGLQGLAKVWIAFITVDAGKTPAYVPGEGVVNVPSHEVPNDPAATPVSK